MAPSRQGYASLPWQAFIARVGASRDCSSPIDLDRYLHNSLVEQEIAAAVTTKAAARTSSGEDLSLLYRGPAM
ncbi:MAG: hypothetical protein H8E66_26095 [Planctomycetes bacterium]|nr:hypothetical protein [Planctomycetota bacterium]